MSISPNIPTPQESYGYESTGTPRWIAVLFGVVIAALAVLGFLGYTTETRMSADLAKQQDQNKILTAQLDQANSRIADLKGQMEVTTQRMGLTQSELAKAKSRAEAIRQEQQTSDQKLSAQLGQVQKESEERQAGAQLGRHERDERADRAQQGRLGRLAAARRPQLLRVHVDEIEERAARRAGADVAEQNGSEESEVHRHGDSR